MSMTDIVITAFAVVILVGVTRTSRPTRPGIVVLLVLLTGGWIWANLRTTGWRGIWGEGAPDGLDPVTKSMFWRGWPLAPFMICLIHGNRFRPNGAEGLVLVVNLLVLFVVLALVAFVGGRWTDRGQGKGSPSIEPKEESR